MACTNTQLDEWNSIIQCMNPSFNTLGTDNTASLETY